MRQTFLKNLFRKNEFDWDSREYLKKTLNLLQETKIHHLWEDDRDAKKQLIEGLTRLMS